MHTKNVAVAEDALDLKMIQSTDRIPTCTKAPLEVGENVPALSYHVSLSSN